MRDAVRLALGTLTVLPVRPPTHVDRRTAGRAMVLAPLVGLALAAASVALLSVLGTVSPLLAAALLVGLLALLTRAIHLDGLADTADGLGSAARPEEALAIMRRSDIGPFGVLSMVLVLVVQVAALGQLVARGTGGQTVTVALVVSRLVLPMLCHATVPAARRDGLGSVVAGSVGSGGLVVAVLAAAVVAALLLDPVRAALTLVVPLAVGGVLARRCVRRLGGVTGDVLGACVETAFTTALVVGCL